MSSLEIDKSFITFKRHGIISLCLFKKSSPTFSENLPTASPAASLTTYDGSCILSTKKFDIELISSLIKSRHELGSAIFPKI